MEINGAEDPCLGCLSVSLVFRASAVTQLRAGCETQSLVSESSLCEKVHVNWEEFISSVRYELFMVHHFYVSF